MVSDRKLPQYQGNLGGIAYYEADQLSLKLYDPFGTIAQEWRITGTYRYSFNGKESDSEWDGGGAMFDYGFRIYDPRLGRFLSVDPLTASYPYYTPYQFAGNMPIAAIDLDGAEVLFQYDYTTLTKKVAKIQHHSEEMFAGEQKSTVYTLSVTHKYRGVQLTASICSMGPKAMRLKELMNNDGVIAFFLKGLYVLNEPRLLYYYSSLQAIYKLTNEPAWTTQDGKQSSSATMEIARALTKITDDPSKVKYGYENTYLHFTGQALASILYGPGAAKFAADMHERKDKDHYLEIFSGKAIEKFSSNPELEQLYTDQVKDIWNNMLGRMFGEQYAKTHGISSNTVWDGCMMAEFLNSVVTEFKEQYPNLKYSAKFEDDEFTQRLAKRINEVNSNNQPQK